MVILKREKQAESYKVYEKDESLVFNKAIKKKQKQINTKMLDNT